MLDSLPRERHEQAGILLTLPDNQANLRRSISANYYALFHLLILAATHLWNRAEHHANLARQFDHKRMKDASTALVKKLTVELTKLTPSSRDFEIHNFLLLVASAFVSLQQERQKAEYDLSDAVVRNKAQSVHEDTTVAFESWDQVKDEPLAHDYLYSLLFKDRY